MSDPTTRIEEENKHLYLTEEDIIEPNGPRELISTFNQDIRPDEQDMKFHHFNLKDVWEGLLSLEKQVYMISPETQEAMGLIVGVNVSQEYAWKHIPFKSLLDNCIDIIEDAKEKKKILKEYKNFKMDTKVLIGYMPILTQDDMEPDENDPFVVFYDKNVIKQALDLIQALEEYEKWIVDKTFYKVPRAKWESHGSDKELTATSKKQQVEEIDVEMQSVFPVKYSSGQLKMRKVKDVRDGYAELIPGERKFDNIFRRRISTAVQAKSPEVTLEQQTDPTFPSNAWTQYVFKIEEGETGLDITSEEECSRPPTSSSKKGPPIMVKKPPPPLSNNIENLLEILNFNQIDMYRNDYACISTKPIPRYSSPYLEEILCFTDLKETMGKKILSIAWYPTLSGLVACCYSYLPGCSLLDIFENPAQFMTDTNQAMLWSLSDSLKFKVKCYAPRGIYILSFCPYAPQYLVGGCVTGQVAIWDLLDKIEKMDEEEMLSQAQTTYRLLMLDFLDWAKPINEKTNLTETIFSDVGISHTNAVTKIDWLDRHLYITSDGKLHRTIQPKNRFFITTAIDGSIAFWDLDIDLSRRMGAKQSKGKLPLALSAMESPLRKFDRIFKPVFMVYLQDALVSNIFDCVGLYDYEPDYGNYIPQDIATKFKIKITPQTKKENRELQIEKDIGEFLQLGKRKPDAQQFLACSLFGNVESFSWDGFDYDIGDPVNKEKIQIIEKYASVHDGPVIQMERNPFLRDIFITIGRYVFAIWKEDYFLTPIIWRRRSSELTSVAWSIDRPSVFYIGRNDGNFEAWDILARDDEPILSDILGGGLLTTLAEHRPKLPKKIVAVGDYIGCLRMVTLPKILQNSFPNEKAVLGKYMDKEVLRKQAIIIWEKKWNQRNEDIIEARKIAEQEAKKEFEKMKKEGETIKKREIQREETKTPTTVKNKYVFDLPEKLERKWEEMNLKRVFEVLMIRKQVNAEKLAQETRLEKQRLAYEKSKKIALKKSLAKIDEDVAALRARILPRVKEDMSRDQMIAEFVSGVLHETGTFSDVKIEADELIGESSSFGDVTITEFYDKGLERREILDKTLGSNLDRKFYYEFVKEEGTINNIFQFDLSRFKEDNDAMTIDTKGIDESSEGHLRPMLDKLITTK